MFASSTTRSLRPRRPAAHDALYGQTSIPLYRIMSLPFLHGELATLNNHLYLSTDIPNDAAFLLGDKGLVIVALIITD